MFTKRQFVQLSVLAATGMLAVWTPTVTAQQLSSDELTSLLENAATKEDHLKLAGRYDAEAKQLRDDADRHEAMRSVYSRMTAKPRSMHKNMARHCEKLVASLREAAKDADELASAHREMANASK